MITIKLDDEIYKEIYVIKKSEWDKMQNTFVSISNKNVKTAFLPGHGTTLFSENKHFIIIEDTEPLIEYAIWRNHNVIGYCNITVNAAEKANAADNAVFYFGFDKTIAPEKYEMNL